MEAFGFMVDINNFSVIVSLYSDLIVYPGDLRIMEQSFFIKKSSLDRLLNL